jgi:HSP20 family protein
MPLAPSRRRSSLADYGTLPALSAMRDEMGRFLDSMFVRPLAPAALIDAGDGSAWIPAVDLSETDTEVLVRVELPGVTPQDVDVSVSGERLVISGEKRSHAETKTDGWVHRESAYGRFSRTIGLPESVDPAKVSAKYEDGVLLVTMAKQPASKAHKIAVTCG